jgi:hypothetical protein
MEQTLNQDVVKYTNRSSALDRSYCCGGWLMFVTWLVLIGLISDPSVPRHFSVLEACIWCSPALLWSLYLLMPWRLCLDPLTRTYSASFGFWLFALQFHGSFDEILGVGVRYWPHGTPAGLYTAIKLKGWHLKRLYILESGKDSKHLTELAEDIARRLDIVLLPNIGICVPPPLPKKTPSGLVRYTQDYAGKAPMRYVSQVGFAILIIFLPLLMWLWDGHKHLVGVMFLSAYLWLHAFYMLYTAGAPWSLTLDYPNNRYALTIGCKPFARSWRETFGRCLGVVVLKATYGSHDSNRVCPYAVALRLDKEKSAENFSIELATNLEEAVIWAQELAQRLGTTVVDAIGRSFAATEPLDDVVTYTQESTIIEQMAAGRCVRRAILCLVLVPLIIAGHFLIQKYHAMQPELAICYWIFWPAIIGLWIPYLVKGSSWKVTLDRRSQIYRSEVHFGPFVKRSTGSFDSVKNVRFETIRDPKSCDPYYITLNFKKNTGRKQFRIAAANTLESATTQTARLALWLGQTN